MTTVRAPRWALSFADLCLVLLGFFIMLHAQSGRQDQMLKSVHDSFASASASENRRDLMASQAFESGEAILKPSARAQIGALARQAAASHARVYVRSTGAGTGTDRFDSWELAAARTAAIARAIRTGGISEADIEISIPQMRSGDIKSQQHIAITSTPR